MAAPSLSETHTRLLDATHTNMFFAQWAVTRHSAWVQGVLLAWLVIMVAYVISLATLFVMRRWKAAGAAKQGFVTWHGVRGFGRGAIQLLVRRRKLILAFAAFFVANLLAHAWFYVWSHEYSGTCGRARECVSLFWGLELRCEYVDEEGSIRPFGPKESCSHWLATTTDLYSLSGIAGSGRGRDGFRVNELRSFYEKQRKAFELNGAYNVGRSVEKWLSYTFPGVQTCHGLSTLLEPAKLQVAWRPTAAATPCWLLTDTGELHLYE